MSIKRAPDVDFKLLDVVFVFTTQSDLFLGRSYKLLSVLEFNSTRKRMSVIVQDEEGKLLLLSKGADRSVSCLSCLLET